MPTIGLSDTSPVRPRRRSALALIVGLVAIALCSVVPVASAGSATGALQYHTERQDYLSPVDDQGCWSCSPAWYVVNPTTNSNWYYGEPACAWNDEDDMLRTGSGYVDPSAASTDRLCLIADLTSAPGVANRPHSIYVNVYAPQKTLRVSLANDAGDTWSAGPPVQSGKQWLWRVCVRDPVADRAGVTSASALGFWPLLAGSNGGRGQRVEYTLTISSPGQRTRNVGSYFEIAGTGPTSTAPRMITNCPG